MRLLSFKRDGRRGLAAQDPKGQFFGLFEGEADYPGSLESQLSLGADERGRLVDKLLSGRPLDRDQIEVLPPLAAPAKIICVGLNYRDHAAESQMKAPDYPTLFARFASSLIGAGAPIVRPLDSTKLDYEGELVAVIGKPGRRIDKAKALEHVAGYSIFNDGSIRDFQLQTPQWTMGKNFDGTGAFGPVYVSADELQPVARGLRNRDPSQRRGHAERVDRRSDLRRGDAGLIHQPRDDAVAGRHYRDRHAFGRGRGS